MVIHTSAEPMREVTEVPYIIWLLQLRPQYISTAYYVGYDAHTLDYIWTGVNCFFRFMMTWFGFN